MSEQAQRVQELAARIQRYQKSYYNGQAEISDQEFDALWDELANIAPEHPLLAAVGADSLDGFPKVAHLIHMGSQEKAANPEAFLSWAAKQKTERFVVQHKLDGASLELQYENGILLRAVTRGDGRIGDEITANALKMNGCVQKLPLAFNGAVRGEVVMLRSVHQARYNDKANCRNAANGLMRRKDSSGSEDLHIICYDAASPSNLEFFKNEEDKLRWLTDCGFNCTPYKSFKNPQEVVSWRERVSAERDSLDWDIDGLVVKCFETDPEDLGRNRPEHQIAFKFQLQEARSILRDVVWSESGATYTPVGIIDPVQLAGTTVKRANLNNPGMIRALGLKIGAPVIVVKRGEIIPKIERRADSLDEGSVVQDASSNKIDSRIEEAEIQYPQHCGSCGSALECTDTRLFCPNTACPKRLHHRVEKWVQVMEIRELGDQLLKRLFAAGLLESVSDLYRLSQEDFSELERMGELSAAKVLKNIRSPRTVSLASFIAGFDLEGLGETQLEKITSAGFNTLSALRAASSEDFSAVDGIGPISAATLVEGLTETTADMDAVLASKIISIAEPLSEDAAPLKGLSFCFSGELESLKRSEAERRVKSLGGSVKSSVVKELSYLVCNDTSSGSSKTQKAATLGVRVLDEAAFLRILETPRQEPIDSKAQAGHGTSELSSTVLNAKQGELWQ